MENRKSVKAIIILLIFSITIFVCALGCQANQWVYFHDKGIRGHVVEADTNKPIEGAIVVTMWQLSQIGSQGFGGYAKVIETETDKEGKFIIPAWKAFKPLTSNSIMHDSAPKVIIYKPGYKVYWSHRVLWEGYPNDFSKTDEDKRKLKEEYSINPAKLQKICTDEERAKNIIATQDEVKLFMIGEGLYKDDIKLILKTLEDERLSLPNKFRNEIPNIY
jgi:hypothetical protein